jgi:predicted phosphodiesterase
VKNKTRALTRCAISSGADEWVVTRRDVLQVSGLVLAGLSVAAPFAYAEETDRKPVLRFGMVTDTHYADTPKRGKRHYRESVPKLEECVALMNREKVDFLIELGDLKDEGKPAVEKNTLKYLETIEGVMAKFDGPRYHVLGNHDIDSISKEQFSARVKNTGIEKDATYYSFDVNGLHCVVLDADYNADGSDYDHGNFKWTEAHIPQKELDWLKKDLASTSNPVLVFVHQLLDGEDNPSIRNAAEVRKVLQESKKVLATFHGHHHAGRHNQIEGIHHYTLKAVVDGGGKENNAYAIVEVYNDDSVVITGYRKAVSQTMEKA